MSYVKFLRILEQCGEEIDWQTESKWLKGIYQHYIPDGSTDNFTSVDMLLTELKDKKVIRIDDLSVLREILTVKKKWSLLQILSKFEDKRKDYRELLEQISRALQESNELQRSISTCVENNLIPRESGENIESVKALFTTLEDQHKLGILNLTILKTIATKVEKPDLCRLVEEFEKRREQEEDAEWWNDTFQGVKAGAASFLSRRIKIGGGIGAGAALAISGEIIGRELIGAVTPHCTFHNLVGGTVVVTTWMVLRKSRNMEEFTNAFKEAVLPLGNFLRGIGEGSIRFTIQAENIFALDALWQSYQDETLQTNLQEFLVTEEIEQLTGGEVRLTVYIDEDEYRNARLDLMISGTEEMKLQEKRRLKDRASSESDLLKERNVTTANTEDPLPEREFLPFDRRARVEEYLENLLETFSEITSSSGGGARTWSSTPSECGFDKGDRLEKLDLVEGFFKEAVENWNSFKKAYKDAYPSEGHKYYSIEKEFKAIRVTLGTLKEMEKEWMIAEPILTSSSTPEAVIQQLENSLRLDLGFFKNSKHRGSIRGLARKAKNLKRKDIFYYLREITPPGTTGP